MVLIWLCTRGHYIIFELHFFQNSTEKIAFTLGVNAWKSRAFNQSPQTLRSSSPIGKMRSRSGGGGRVKIPTPISCPSFERVEPHPTHLPPPLPPPSEDAALCSPSPRTSGSTGISSSRLPHPRLCSAILPKTNPVQSIIFITHKKPFYSEKSTKSKTYYVFSTETFFSPLQQSQLKLIQQCNFLPFEQ